MNDFVFEFRQRQNIFLLQNPGTEGGAHTASCLVGTGVFSPEVNRSSLKLTTHLHILSRLGMSGALPLLPLYTSMARKSTTLCYFFTCFSCSHLEGMLTL